MVELALAGPFELGGGLNLDQVDVWRGRRSCVGGYERDLRAPPRGPLGQGKPHPAGRAIADEAHTVDRFARPPRRHEHAKPRPWPRSDQCLDSR